MKKGLVTDVQVHSEGKEMALWVLIGVRCNMANFLFYKDHQAVMWILEKIRGWGWVEIDDYCSYFGKNFK